MEDACIFCRIVAGELKSEKLAESENFVVIRDAYPKVLGHSLVVSKGHFKDFMEMDSGLAAEMFDLVKKVCRQEGWGEFNLLTNNGKNAGQAVWHLHFHILPRREGDGFRIGV